MPRPSMVFTWLAAIRKRLRRDKQHACKLNLFINGLRNFYTTHCMSPTEPSVLPMRVSRCLMQDFYWPEVFRFAPLERIDS